jgi:hypothetical protein
MFKELIPFRKKMDVGSNYGDRLDIIGAILEITNGDRRRTGVSQK